LFHSGTSVHADLPDPAQDLRGVVALDGTRAVYALTQRTASTSYPSGRIALPGLLPDSRYKVRLSHPLTEELGNGQSPLEWALEGVELPGSVLGAAGLQSPVLFPEQAVLITVDQAS
jgi:alpha-galactosidase